LLDTSTTPAGSVMQAMGRCAPLRWLPLFRGDQSDAVDYSCAWDLSVSRWNADPDSGREPWIHAHLRHARVGPPTTEPLCEDPVTGDCSGSPVLGFLVLVMHWFASASFPVLIALSATTFALYESLYVVVGASALEKQMYSGAIREVARYALAHAR
jgi:hypothetical protein